MAAIHRTGQYHALWFPCGHRNKIMFQAGDRQCKCTTCKQVAVVHMEPHSREWAADGWTTCQVSRLPEVVT